MLYGARRRERVTMKWLCCDSREERSKEWLGQRSTQRFEMCGGNNKRGLNG